MNDSNEKKIGISKDAHVIAIDLKKYFKIKRGFLGDLLAKEDFFVRAVDGVSFYIKRGEVFALVGESGCGKTTTGRLLLRLIEPTSGRIYFDGADLLSLNEIELRKIRRKMQIIFQDPYESLSPRMSVYDILAEPLENLNITNNEVEKIEKVTQILEAMDLVPTEQFLFKFPHELSGGQRQRVAIGRAFIVDPEFVVADEPVSMLDASIRAGVLKLILEMVKKAGVTFLFITHDMALARHICSRIAIMYLGKIVEIGDVDKIIYNPTHPYTEALIAAVPVPDPTARRVEAKIKGEIPTSISPPPGCRFHPRCPYAKEKCKKEEPKLIETEEGRYVACHFPVG